MKHPPKLAASLLPGYTLSLADCATPADTINTTYASPLKYRDFTYTQIATNNDALSARITTPHQPSKKQRHTNHTQIRPNQKAIQRPTQSIHHQKLPH